MYTALVIDDNKQTADSFCKMLSLLDVEARPVYGSRSAILALKHILPDVIFMDIHMPGISGFEVMAYLKRIPKLVNVPVVYISYDDQPEIEKQALDTGGLKLLIKPPTFEMLEKTLRELGMRT